MSIKIHILRCGVIEVASTVPMGSASVLNYAAQTLAPDSARVTLPVCCYLIEHPKGLVLVDTGWSREISPRGVYDERTAGQVLPGHLVKFYKPQVGAGQTSDEQLAAMGVRAEDLDCLLLTHLDPDHVGNLRKLQGAKRILLPEDEYFWSCRTVYKTRQPWRLWMDVPMERFFYRGSPIGPNRWAFDVFGDESLYMVSVPGHTDGMGAVLINSGKGYALLTADAAFSRRNWQELSPPGFGFDAKLQMKSLKWVREMAMADNCAACLASHDPDEQPRTIEF